MNESNVGGKFDQIAGKVKQGLGEAFGDEKLANEGAAEEVKGHAKEAWGNVKDAASDTHEAAKTDASTRTEQTGESFRDKVTSAAEHAKDLVNRGIDHLKDEHRS